MASMTVAPEISRHSWSLALLPSDTPLALLYADGQAVPCGELDMPGDGILLELHHRMVLARRFDTQATALTKQGRLAVYPSAHGQEAAEIGAVLALREQDWLFPTYRDTMAVVSRGLDPAEVLTLLRGDWHCGYDPYEHRVAPQCTPLATSALHAVGVAHAARVKHEDAVALAMLGDGATSEGDTHVALNFAAVWKAPVVFFVQNNGYAISVPLAKQTAAPSLAHKGIGYGIPALMVDGNDAAAVYAAVRRAVASAAAGAGPVLIEALTYRVEPHTNADDATRYRTAEEVAHWVARDPQAATYWLREAVRRNPADGDAHFVLGASLAAGGNSWWLATSDLNGDTRPDFVVANSGTGDINVLLNTTN